MPRQTGAGRGDPPSTSPAVKATTGSLEIVLTTDEVHGVGSRVRARVEALLARREVALGAPAGLGSVSAAGVWNDPGST